LGNTDINMNTFGNLSIPPNVSRFLDFTREKVATANDSNGYQPTCVATLAAATIETADADDDGNQKNSSDDSDGNQQRFKVHCSCRHNITHTRALFEKARENLTIHTSFYDHLEFFS